MKTSFKMCPTTIYRNALEDVEGAIFSITKSLVDYMGFALCIESRFWKYEGSLSPSNQHHNGSFETSRQTRLESALVFNEHLTCAFPLKLS